MSDDPDFAGANSIPELIKQARNGLPREGITALELSENNIHDHDREITRPHFTPYHDTAGCEVDVARYLEGEPENMIGYQLEDTPQIAPVITLAVNIAYPWSISHKAIIKHGQALVALAEAIEASGRQTEIWADCTVDSGLSGAYSGRITVRLKAPGELFDTGTFMFAMTHPGMLRGLLLNTMHAFPQAWHRPLSVGSDYGICQNEKLHIDKDYPTETIYIPAMMADKEADKIVKKALKELNLLIAA